MTLPIEKVAAGSTDGTIAAKPARRSARHFPVVVLPLAPGVGYLGLLFGYPLVSAILGSFGLFTLGQESELTVRHYVDLFVNISSLHEMRIEQIHHYLAEIRRLVKPDGHFYLKAWKVSNNPIENIVIREEDYPLDGWVEIFRRTTAVQTRFFETLVKKPSCGTSETTSKGYRL